MILHFPEWSTVIRGAPWLVVSTLTLLTGAPRPIAGVSRWSQACCRLSQASCRCSQVLPGVPEGHSIRPANTGIWPPRDSFRQFSDTPRVSQSSQYILLMTLAVAASDNLNDHQFRWRTHIWVHSSFSAVSVHPYTLCDCPPARRCTWMSWFDCIPLCVLQIYWCI